ncbi:MAG: UDP-N-acetylmuramoyl-L-alanyl-D-glutamate--2,6-diaminopimelate ligase [Planctomycetota bacterium]
MIINDATTPLERPTVWELLEEHGGILFSLDEGAPISIDDPRAEARPVDVHLHSGRVRGGDLFAALPGHTVEGVEYVPDAIRRGARVILAPADRPVALLRERCTASGVAPEGAIAWLHPRARAVAGAIADDVHGRPAASLMLAGVTGTNGKTSVAHLTSQILERARYRPGVLGTAGHVLRGARGPVHLQATHTTPDVTEVVRLLARHRAHGGRSALMEMSSHALQQERVHGLSLQVGAFTNLTREHLDYHGSMEAYAAAKARLWECVVPGGIAVVFGHDGAARAMRRAAAARGLRVVTVDIDRRADLTARDVHFDERGASFRLCGMGLAERHVHLPLSGMHNVENALVACAIARAFGCPSTPLVEGLENAVAPPGRLEPIAVPEPVLGERFDVYVDYAHSPDALERVLRALRADLERRAEREDRSVGRLICVFGCGGDRDRGKRGPMGRAAGIHADVSIVTSDNPRTEDPAAIADSVVAGIDETAGRRIVELDRRRAIECALGMARPNDLVLIAGKGHENTQTIGDLALPFDDRVVATEALAALANDEPLAAVGGGAR